MAQQIIERFHMKKCWVLVLVKRGLIESPVICLSRAEALRMKDRLLRGFNIDYDEFEMFEKRLDLRKVQQ